MLRSRLCYVTSLWRCWVGHVSKKHSGLLHDVTVHSYLPLRSAPNDICMLVITADPWAKSDWHVAADRNNKGGLNLVYG